MSGVAGKEPETVLVKMTLNDCAEYCAAKVHKLGLAKKPCAKKCCCKKAAPAKKTAVRKAPAKKAVKKAK